MWPCSNCLTLNQNELTSCTHCNSEKPSKPVSKRASVADSPFLQRKIDADNLRHRDRNINNDVRRRSVADSVFLQIDHYSDSRQGVRGSNNGKKKMPTPGFPGNHDDDTKEGRRGDNRTFRQDPNTKKQLSRSAEYDKYKSTPPQQGYTAVSNPPAHYPSKSPHKESLHPNIEISSDKPQHEIDPNAKKQLSRSEEYHKGRLTRPQQGNSGDSKPPAHYHIKSPHKESHPPNMESSSDITQHGTVLTKDLNTRKQSQGPVHENESRLNSQTKLEVPTPPVYQPTQVFHKESQPRGMENISSIPQHTTDLPVQYEMELRSTSRYTDIDRRNYAGRPEIPRKPESVQDYLSKSMQKHLPGIQSRKQKTLLVVAIDFGTTYSGYAYAFGNEYKQDRNKIYTNLTWSSGDGLATYKTPTSILFRKNGIFHSFGYDAERNYAEFMEDNCSEDYILFSRFKMKLFQNEGRAKKISKNFMLYDDRHKNQMRALTVFAESIKFFMKHFKESCRVQSFELRDGDIHWVLTVPAIWTDNAKQFMRLAAEEAGIAEDLLTLAYEPEAAAIYCKEMTVQRMEGTEGGSMDTFNVGQRFLVLDCGGGTVDVTAYEVQENFHLRELERPTGGPWGGTVVDETYMEFLKELVGRDKWRSYETENPEDVLEIKRRFELKKKCVSNENQIVTIPFPSSFGPGSLKQSLSSSSYSQTVFIKNEKLRFRKDLVRAFFEKPIVEIIKHLDKLLNTNLRNIRAILMVGGFSECKILYEAVKSKFKHLAVICPPDAVIAVLKGAVMFGHNPDLISERICPRTYGITVNVPFDPKIHPKHLKTVVEGMEKCTDVFKKIVEKGQQLIVGKSIFPVRCHPTRSNDSEAHVEVYESIEKNPQFTLDEGVRPLGTLCVPIPDTYNGKSRVIEIQMMFGFTEIFVTATELGTDKQYRASFNCIMN